MATLHRVEITDVQNFGERQAQLLAIRPCIPNPGTHPLPYQISLKLRNRTYDCEERLPQRAAGVDVLLVADELNAERPKLLQCREKMFGGASEPIKAPLTCKF
jgi:hypothetical protein